MDSIVSLVWLQHRPQSSDEDRIFPFFPLHLQVLTQRALHHPGPTSGGWTDQGQNGTVKSIGTRVGRVSLDLPGASHEANDKEFMVSPFHGGIQKRTLRKAIRTAAQTGTSQYRGKKMLANVNIRSFRSTHSNVDNGQCVQIFSWNCSGLSQQVLAELLLWLEGKQPTSLSC